jgi:hypothetical protein
LNHAVLVVGYGTTTDGQEYWSKLINFHWFQSEVVDFGQHNSYAYTKSRVLWKTVEIWSRMVKQGQKWPKKVNFGKNWSYEVENRPKWVKNL